MQESGKNRAHIKKAYEIAYAAFRIAAKMGEHEFAEQLKNAGISLLGSVAVDDYGSAKRRLAALEYLIRFAMDVNIMGMTNGEIMLKEIAGFGSALETVEMEKTAATDETDIAGIFSEVDSVVPANGSEQSGKSESGNGNGGDIGNILKSAIRQSAILDRIRQSGNCRIKDIQDVLPDSSERTIRYDLQTMVEQNLIERVGSGGPSVFYRVKQGT